MKLTITTCTIIVINVLKLFLESEQWNMRNIRIQHLNDRCMHQPVPPSVLVAVTESPFIVISNISLYVSSESQLFLLTSAGQLKDEIPSTVTVVGEPTQSTFTCTALHSSEIQRLIFSLSSESVSRQTL